MDGRFNWMKGTVGTSYGLTLGPCTCAQNWQVTTADSSASSGATCNRNSLATMGPSWSPSYSTVFTRLLTFVNLAFPSKFCLKHSSLGTCSTAHSTSAVGDRG